MHMIWPVADIVSLSAFRTRKGQSLGPVKLQGLAARHKKPIFFNREELGTLLSLYSSMVAKGVWKDYAIDQLQGQAIFSVFRHANEAPVFMIAKQVSPNGKGRQFQIYDGMRSIKKSETLTDAVAALRIKVAG